jgi:uroporphyrinogen decarboxylase
MPDFKQFEKVLRKEIPDRPVLFEFFLNDPLYKRAIGGKFSSRTQLDTVNSMIAVFDFFGYDYANVRGSEYRFYTKEETARSAATVSLNAGATITDRESFDAYRFMDAARCDYSALDRCDMLPGQKLIAWGPGGVLENVIALVGFDNLCLMIYDDEQLVYDIFEAVGSGFVEYYRQCGRHKNVGACISNDDWGFNTQTMLAPADMRRFVFPWHKKIVETIHAADKYALLHSCGNYSMILDDLYALNYDGRHSYEDKIERVEDACERFRGKLAVLGGIDLNWLINADEAEIVKRARALVENGMKYGGYALGSGNSIPEYVPVEKYLAMIGVVKKVVLS